MSPLFDDEEELDLHVGVDDFDFDDERPIVQNNVNIGSSTTATSMDLKDQLFNLQKKLNINNIKHIIPPQNSEPEIHLPPSFQNQLSFDKPPDKSIDFLGELSDNLLMQSRKLNYENKQYKKQLNSINIENDSMKKQISNLSLLNNELSKKEELLNDKIWNLETEVGNFKNYIEKAKSDLIKLNSENSNSNFVIEELKLSIENLNNEKKKLNDNSNLTISKLNSQINELKDSNNNLNDENDILHKNIVNLKSDLNTLKLNNTNNDNNNNEKIDELNSSFSEFDDSIIYDPLPNNLDLNSHLDIETLQKNLKLSYHHIFKLNSQNNKLKSDLLKFKNKNKKFIDENENEDQNENENENENSWVNFEDDSFIKNNSNIITDDIIGDIDDDNDADDDVLVDLSQISISSPVNTRKSSISNQADSFILIVPKTTLDMNNDKLNLKKIDLSEFQTIPLSNNIGNKLLINSSSNDTNDQKNYFNDEKLQLIPCSEFENLNNELKLLKSSIDNPSFEYIKSKSEINNHIMIPINDHNNLHSNIKISNNKILKLENLNSEHLNSLSVIKQDFNKINDLLNIKIEESNNLKNQLENPTLDYIKLKSESHNHVLISLDDHNELNSNIESFKIEISNLENLNNEQLKDISSIKENLDNKIRESDNLKDQLENPTLDYIKSKSESHNHIVLSLDDHTELNSNIKYLKEKILNLEVLNSEQSNSLSIIKSEFDETNKILDMKNDEFNDLKNKFENPLLEYIILNSKIHNHIAIPINDYESLHSNIKNSNDKYNKLESLNNEQLNELSILKKEVTDKSQTIDTINNQIESINSKLENPSIDYIKSKSSLHDLICIDLKYYGNLKLEITDLQIQLDKSNDEIFKSLKSVDQLTDEIQILEDKIRNPDLEYMKEKSSLLKYSFIPEIDYINLESKLTIYEAQLKEKEIEISKLIESKNQSAIKVDQLESYVSDLKIKNSEFESKIKELEKLYETPEMDYLKNKLFDTGFTTITIDEHDKLKQINIESQKKINDLINDSDNFKVENEKLLLQLDKKEIELNSFKLKLDSINNDMSDLKSKFENPDIEYIKSKASFLHNLTTIPTKEHELIEEELKSAKINLQDYNNLKHEFDDKQKEIELLNNSKLKLEESINEATQSLSSRENELQLLKQQLESPTSDYLKEKSVMHGLIVLPIDEHDSLQKQLSENCDSLAAKERELTSIYKIKADLERQAEIQGSKSVSLELHESVQNDLEKINHELREEKKNVENLKNIEKMFKEKENELIDLKKKTCDLEMKTAKLDQVIFELETLKSVESELAEKRIQLDKMISEKAIMQQKIDDLQNKEIALNESLKNLALKESELNSMKSLYDQPQLEYIKEKSKLHGFVPIKSEEHELNKSKLVELEDVKKENNELNDQIVDLSTRNNELSEINFTLEKSISQLNQLKKQLENPDAKYIKEKSSLLGLITLPLSEHNDLNKNINDLSSKLETSESKIKTVELEKSKLNEKVKELELLQTSPTVDYIHSKSASLGIIPIPIIEHTAMKSELQRKNILLKENKKQLEELSTLRSDIADKKKKLKDKADELDKITDNYEKPTLDYLKEKLSTFSLTAVDESDLKSLEKSKEDLTEIVDKLKAKLLMVENSLQEKDNQLVELSEKLTKANTQYSSEINVIKLNHEKILNEKQSKIDGLSMELKTNTDKYESSMAIIENKSIGYQNEVLEKNKQLVELTEKLELTIKQFESKINNVKIESSSYQSRLEAKEKEFSTLSDDHILIKNQHESSVSEIKSITENYERTLNDKSQEIGELSEQLRVAEDRHESIVSEFKTKSEKYENEVKQMVSEVALLSDKLKMLQSQHDSTVDEYNCKNSDYEKKLIMKTREFEELAEKLKMTITEHENVINDRDSKDADYEKMLEEKTNELERLSEHLKVTEVQHKAEINEIENINTDFKKNIEDKTTELEELSMSLKSMQDKHEIEIKELKTSSEIDENKLYEIAASRNLAIVSIEDYHKGNDMKKSASIATVTPENVNDIYNQPLDLIISSLDRRGYIVMKNDEYENIMSNIHNDNAEMIELADISHEVEDIESDLESKKHILEEMDNRSKYSSTSSNCSIISTSVSVENILTQKVNSLKQKVKDIDDEITSLKAEKTITSKQVHRLSISSGDYLDDKLNNKLSAKLKKIENMIEVKEIELKSQQSALVAVEAYLAKSTDMDLPPITTYSEVESSDKTDRLELEREISELQIKYDEKKQKMDKLTKEINESSEPEILVEKLTLLGYEVKSPSGEYSNQLKHCLLNGSKVSVNSLVQSEYFDAVSGTYDLDDMAKNNGYMLVSVDNESKKTNENINSFFKLEDISLEDLKSRAKELGYVVMQERQMKLLVTKSKEPKLPDTFTVVELQQYADKLGLHILSNNDLGRLKKRTITTHELASKAAELNLVLMSQPEVDKLKTREPLNEENLIIKGKDLGYLCIPTSQFVATTVSRTADIPNVTVLPNSYYKILTKSHEWYKKNKDSINNLKQKTPVIPENGSFDMDSFAPERFNPNNSGYNSPQLPATHIDAVSLNTVNTVISNKKEIIAAVTQTIIGEYLFKYYRKLGPFTSISDTRHERFFWIHPYSMTLYWSNVNPVLSDPAKNQIKAISILDVQCVADNNPLPPGLYHKSIIIKSYDKNVKITCPTRQRHNIWFNSLKFLLERSADNWVNDDDLEDQYRQDFTLDKKTELERTQSHSLRHSHPRRSPSSVTRPDSRMSSRPGSSRMLSGYK